MKTTTFIFCLLLLLVSCGKDNKSGPRQGNSFQPFSADLEIQHYDYTANTVHVTSSTRVFDISAPSISLVRASRNIIGVISQGDGTRVQFFNAAGKQIMNMAIGNSTAEIFLEDDLAAITLNDSQGDTVLHSFNASGTTLVSNLHARIMRVQVSGKLLTATFVSDRSHALAIRSNGEVLVATNQVYQSPQFIIGPYTLVFRHRGGMQEFTR